MSISRHSASSAWQSSVSYVWQCAAAFANLCRHGTNELHADDDAVCSHFHSTSEPAVTLIDYIRRVEAEAHCGEDGFLIALVLIGRACNDRRAPKLLLPSVLTAHRLLLTGLRVATKMHHDVHRSNRTMAKLGGISNKELNLLERAFLQRLDFNAAVLPEELDRVKTSVHLACAIGPTKTAAAIILANGMRLELTLRLPRPLLNVASFDDMSPEGSPLSAGGGGHAAARSLRSGRSSMSTQSCGGDAPSPLRLSISELHPLSTAPFASLSVTPAGPRRVSSAAVSPR